jgi:hypothetical protein
MPSRLTGFLRPSPFNRRQRIPLALCASIALVLFVTAYHFKTIGTCNGGLVTWFDSSTVLWFGWGGVIFFQFGWYANVLFALLIFHLFAGRPADRRFAIMQGILVLSTFLSVKLAHNEAFSEKVCAYGPGLWLWVLAQGVVMAAAITMLRVPAVQANE